MSEYNINCAKLIDCLKSKPFLFPKGMKPIRVADYFMWFDYQYKTEFNQMTAMCHYDASILDQYAKKVVWTGFMPTDGRGGAYALHTLVQVNKAYHILFLYGYEEKKVSVIPTIYAVDVQDYITFLNDNDKYLIRENSKAGFGGLMMGETA